MVPNELAELPIWKIANGKQPVTGPLLDEFAAPYTALPSDASKVMCFDRSLPYIGIDVDDLPDGWTFETLPRALINLLSKYPTYVEISVSGKGLHLIYKTDKSTLPDAISRTSISIDKCTMYISRSVFLMTGNTLPGFDEIGEIPIEVLWNIKDSQAPLEMDGELPRVTPFMLQVLLAHIEPSPVTAGQVRVCELVSQWGLPVSDYDIWILTSFAYHHSCQDFDGYDIWHRWCAKDPYKYPGEYKCRQAWEAIRTSPNRPVTFQTLYRMAEAGRPDYPFLNSKGVVIGSIIENWLVFINHFGLRFEQEVVSQKYRMVGGKLLDNTRWTANPDEFRDIILRAAQVSGFSGSAALPFKVESLLWPTAKPINEVQTWIDEATAADCLPKECKSYLEWLCSTLHYQYPDQKERYDRYVEIQLYQLIRGIYYSGNFSSSSGILILSGPENTFKSTWCRMLLPKELDHLKLSSMQTGGKYSASGIKELQMEAATCVLWIKDEIEGLMKRSDDLLKAFLTMETDDYRPLYGKNVIKVPRRCMFFGTTNLDELPITDRGARRYMIVPVRLCDTTELAKIPMVKVYQELRDRLANASIEEVPNLWSATTLEAQATTDANEEFRAETNADVWVYNTYDYDTPPPPPTAETFLGLPLSINSLRQSPYFKTLGQAANDVRLMTSSNIEPTTLKHSLRRKSVVWVGHNHITFANPAWEYKYGVLRYRTSSGKVGWQADVVPLIRKE